MTSEEMTSEERFLELLPQIERVLGAINRRYALDAEEAEDFAAWAQVKLIEDDYRRIGAFEQRSKITTYLRAVLANLFRDYRIEKWGKYRVSKAATRLGPAAVALDRLIRRDRRSEYEAIQIVLARSDVEEDEETLESMVRALPARNERHEQAEPEEFFTRTPALGQADDTLFSQERREQAAPVLTALRQAVAELPATARLILNLRFFEGLQVVEIARQLEREAKPLYREIDGLLRQLRSSLLARGIEASVIQEVLAHTLEAELEASAAGHEPAARGASAQRPSNQGDGPSAPAAGKLETQTPR